MPTRLASHDALAAAGFVSNRHQSGGVLVYISFLPRDYDQRRRQCDDVAAMARFPMV